VALLGTSRLSATAIDSRSAQVSIACCWRRLDGPPAVPANFVGDSFIYRPAFEAA
jgi:hypothetical protein